MDLKERLAFIKGLAEGLEIDKSTREGKLLLHVIKLMDGMTRSIVTLENDYDALYDYVESIDEDLTSLEEEVEDFFEDLDDEDDHGDDDLYDYDLDDEDDDDDDDDFFLEDGGHYSIECPDCQEELIVEEDDLETCAEILCPRCHQVVFSQEDEDLEKEDEELGDGEE